MQPHMPLLNLCKFDVNRLPLVNTEQYCIFWNVLLVLSKKNSSRKLSLKYGYFVFLPKVNWKFCIFEVCSFMCLLYAYVHIRFYCYKINWKSFVLWSFWFIVRQVMKSSTFLKRTLIYFVRWDRRLFLELFQR